jgi:hypothetical protein
MDMALFNCDRFELDLRVPAENFNKDAFLEDVKENWSLERNISAWSFGSRSSPGKQHAHMTVDCRSRKYVRANISYHRRDYKTEDIRPPYMEDCAQWLGSFIQENTVEAAVMVGYIFGPGFSPAIGLPFPLLSFLPDQELNDASVAGIAIHKLLGFDRITIETARSKIFLGMQTKKAMNLSEFHVDEALRSFSPLVNKLIKEIAS